MSTPGTTRQLVVFSLGEEEYALPITHVQEIIRYSEPRSVAADDAWIRGVISLRGKIVPVCDLSARLGLPSRTDEDAKIVIVEAGGRIAGVVVSEVEEVLSIEDGQVDSVPTAGVDCIEGIAKLGDRLVVLLNPDGIFRAPELAAAA
jgi:purine-binding chemotaxis protein CheW